MKNLLFNPFEIYSEKTLLIIGLLFTIIGSYLAFQFNVRYDGVIDLHIVPTIAWKQPFTDNFVNILCSFICLFIAAKIINSKTRWIDILSTTLIARIPYYFLPLFNIDNAIGKKTAEFLAISKNIESAEQFSFSGMGFFILFSIISVLCIIWLVALLYNGYKVAAHAKGNKSVVLFVMAIIIAEILSKIFISKI